MSIADSNPANKSLFLMGNEAIARGALEAGVQFAAGYPGTPSSEILQNLANAAKKVNIHAEWSINEKVASESAGAAAFAGRRGEKLHVSRVAERGQCAARRNPNGFLCASDELGDVGRGGLSGAIAGNATQVEISHPLVLHRSLPPSG